MELFIFKTNISTHQTDGFLAPLFNHLPFINRWSIDLDDVDKVLKIETTLLTKEDDVLHLLKGLGVKCEVLMN